MINHRSAARLDLRVEAAGCARSLDEYYNGSASPIRISLPRGGYAAVFERAVASAAPLVEAPQPRRSRIAIPLGAMLLIAIAQWSLARPIAVIPDPRPTAAVLRSKRT